MTILAFGTALTAVVDGGLAAIGTQAGFQYVAVHLGVQVSGTSAGFIFTGAVGAGGWAGALANQIENQIGLPLFANFLAITCDAFAFPRTFDDAPVTFERQKKKQDLPRARVPQQPAIFPLTQARQWKTSEDMEQQIKNAMHADNAGAA